MRTTVLIQAFNKTVFIFYYLSTALASDNNPFTYNGGSIMGMAGKNCVALAVDKRYASGSQMVVTAPRRVLTVHSKLLVGLVGLDGDVQTFAQEVMTHVLSKANRESGGLAFIADSSHRNSSTTSHDCSAIARRQRRISPRAMASLMSHVLYSSRVYCEPLLVGLQESEDDQNKPIICSMDMLGAKMQSSSFACSGVASKSLYGMAEAMWRPDMEEEELVRVCGRAFLSALERDCLSGYGAVIYLITPKHGIIEYELSTRTD